MPKIPADIRSLCRAYTDATVRIVGGIAQNKHTPDSVRIQAIAMLWERGWGRPAQPLTGEDGEGEIKIIIRNIIEEKRLALAAGQVIEHDEPADDSPSGGG